MPLLRLRSSEGKLTMSRKIEPVRMSFCRHGSCTFTEPNRTELVNSGTGRNRTRKKNEPNRTEPRRVRKTQAELRRTEKNMFPNRTEAMNFEKSGTETNRIKPVPSCCYRWYMNCLCSCAAIAWNSWSSSSDGSPASFGGEARGSTNALCHGIAVS